MNKIKLVVRRNGCKTKDCCVGCKYDDFDEWLRSDKDNCFLCDNSGSERTPKEYMEISKTIPNKKSV